MLATIINNECHHGLFTHHITSLFMVQTPKFTFQQANLATISSFGSSPASIIVSHLTSWARPSIKTLQRSTSPFPILSALEISKHPPVEALSTPPVPLAYRLIFPRSSFQSSLPETPGRLTMAPALSPVPKFDGHVRTKP